jgi:anti-sigma regulatory factor (Ser/Thr protein kinase)
MMGLFKSGKSKADDLLSILIPSLQWQMQEELKKRLMAQMEDVVREAANQVIAYGYKEAIKELTIQVRAPKRQWVGLTDEEIKELLDCGRGGLVDIKKAEQMLKEKNT